MTQIPKTWFITGASSGLGRALAEAVLARGYRAVLAARRLEPLQDIAKAHGDRALPLQLDVTDRASRQHALRSASDTFGSVDFLANIAGFGSYGALENFTFEQIRAQMELNFFAAAELSLEVLPQMRARQSGHILNLTSIAGMAAMPGCGPYNASKFALEGFTEALHHEVKPLGVRVTLIEPGAFRTEFAGNAAMKADGDIPDYADLTSRVGAYFAGLNANQIGDPIKAAEVMIDMVESDRTPVRLMLGKDAYQGWERATAARQRDLEMWRARGEDTAF